MRTVTELSNLNGRVYVYLSTAAIKERFLMDAEKEGFTFGDGAKPTDRDVDDIYAVNNNHTINFLGTIGRMAYRNSKTLGENRIIRVDYEKYVMGCSDYVI